VRVTRAVSRAYQPEGQSLWQSNGAAAGIYPASPRTDAPTDEALAKIGERIRREIV
jgi:hypothetical protein